MTQDWDQPKRSRSFLLAAAATALCGVLYTWNDTQSEPDRLEAKGPAAVVVRGAQQQAVASNAPTVPVSGDLRDAMAAPAASPVAPPVALAALRGPGGLSLAAASRSQSVAASPSAAAMAARAFDHKFSASGGKAPRAGESGSALALSTATADAETADRSVLDDKQKLVIEWVRRSGERPDAARTERAPDRAADDASRPPEPGAWPETAEGLAAGGASGAHEPASSGEDDAAAKTRAARARKPVSLATLLGKGALKPPRSKFDPPKRDPWTLTRPARRADGSPLSAKPWPLLELEQVEPPAGAEKVRCGRDRAHWHDGALSGWWHDGTAWGRESSGRWVWLERAGQKWWAYPDPKAKPALSHEERWWLSEGGLWFLLHDGQPWGYRYFAQFKQEGFQSADGMQLLYSADGSRLAVVVPGEGAAAYDAVSGAELGRWTPDQLPKKPAPRGPSSVALPR